MLRQPLHLGLDLRVASPELMDVFTNEELIRIAADDRLGKMGRRATMSDGRLNGTQVWARELSDGAMLVGLLNADMGAASVDNCTWEHRAGGYFQVTPRTPDGNFACYLAGELDRAKAACCAAGLKQCVSVDEGSNGAGCSKRNDRGGWVNDSSFSDWIITNGHQAPVVAPPRTICVNLTDVGLNPYANASVRDVWAAQGRGLRLGHFCAQVASHDMALFVLRQ